MSKRRYKEEQMRVMVARYKNSDLGRKAFCALEKINEQTFYYWWCKLKKEQEQPTNQSTVFQDFIPIQAPALIPSPKVITIELPTQIRIALPLDYAPADLCTLIRSLSC